VKEPADTIACALVLSDEAVDRIAERVLDRIQLPTDAPWMNLKAAAEYLDWPPKRLYNLVAKEGIPHRKHGNRLLFNRQELDRWLDLHYQGPSDFAP
jgi:excisionase family DNA binding protein